MLDLLHFVGGFGATAGLPLRHWELLAIQSAAKLHPSATVVLHHAPGSWANAPSACERVVWSEAEASQWRTWTASHGAHQSDRVRLLALLRWGGLYQDTDSFMLANCDELSQYDCAIPWQTRNRTVVNGFISARPGSDWLRQVYDEVDQLGSSRGWDGSSCKLYSKLYRQRKQSLTALPPELYTITTWHKRDKDMLFGPLTAESLLRYRQGKVLHAMSSGMPYATKLQHMDNPPPGSLYELMLRQIEIEELLK